MLFKIEPGALSGTLAIKCPRCKAHNSLRPQSPSPKRPDQSNERDGKEGQNAHVIRDQSTPAAARNPRETEREPL
ncbi:hypothetical protein [Leisingera sp. M658]|uniref:hypothetical protein n=1 Tax=Leisingera sp. M658 TaxID=2867015 RepID=UPI0038FCA682